MEIQVHTDKNIVPSTLAGGLQWTASLGGRKTARRDFTAG
jgi:hypothetical protein